MVYDHQRWRRSAACRNLSAEDADRIFFIGTGKSARLAREFCNHCPVQRQCLDYALYYHETGIWGGTTDSERKVLTIGLFGLLTKAQVESHGINADETREQTQWGLGTVQILQSRKKDSPAPAEPKPQPPDPQPPMLVIQL